MVKISAAVSGPQTMPHAVRSGLSTRMAMRSRCNGTPILVNLSASPEVTATALPDRRAGPINHAASSSLSDVPSSETALLQNGTMVSIQDQKWARMLRLH
ncbi:hypothetical protein MAE02_36020 [Microvirga aerophila]|uniref:Uncharacterized protein n=1 Tax=Microvirga aerophila TaxID=670291 RepID=A0A512BVB4_9HYPH|nr:hypothetical protein MAE02_36020 [Microvirga aerophila]